MKRALGGGADLEEGFGKRTRMTTDMVEVNSRALARREGEKQERTSSLSAPTMMLTGHEAAVFSLAFDPKGQFLASGSRDKCVFLWKIHCDCENYMALRGHKNAVLQVCWSAEGDRVASASADKTVGVWNAETGTRSKLNGHTGVVNSVAFSRSEGDAGTLVCSGSDDRMSLLWDARAKGRPVRVLSHAFQVTSVDLDTTTNRVFTGGLDEVARVWDLRRADEPALTLEGHTNTITGIRMSRDGASLLTNGMDGTLRTWDVSPFCEGSRSLNVFRGVQHGNEKSLLKCGWSPCGKRVFGGSSDQIVKIFDAESTELLYHLPGHAGTVQEVAHHPTEPIIGSCGNDKAIFLGEISK